MVAVICMSLVYPVFGLWSKTNGFHTATGWSLLGTGYLDRQSPDEMAVIHWLQSSPLGVVAEAVSPTGGSYSNYARVSMLTGLPAVLGWMGHESQWRGGSKEMGSRQQDITRLYCSQDWDETRGILEQYQIRYIFVGILERSTYVPGSAGCASGLAERKFDAYLELVFQQGGIKVYEYGQ